MVMKIFCKLHVDSGNCSNVAENQCMQELKIGIIVP